MGDTAERVEKPVADPSQVAPAGAPKGVGEDPPGGTDADQEAFVLEAFQQDLFGGDEVLGVSEPRPRAEEVAPAPAPSAEGAPPEAAPAPTVEQPQVGAAGPQVQAEPAVPPPIQVPGQPATPPADAPQVAAPVPPVAPQAQPQAAPEYMFQHLEAEVAKNREVFEKALEEQVYKLSDKEQEELRDNVEVAVPKLLSRMHVNVVQNMLSTIAQQLPGVVGGLIQARTRSRDREDTFYQRWPQLDRAQHGETVKQLARSFMHANPTADFETAVRMVGAQALVALNLPVGTAGAAAGQAQQGGAQQQPRTATPGKVVRQVAQPYVPGGVQAAGAPAAGNGMSQNPFEVMDQFLLQDEQGMFDR